MKTLIYLGQVNAIRNLNRSLLTVLALALAATVMTCSLTLSEGYTPARAAGYRAFLGGDILVYPAWVWPTQPDVAALIPREARVAALPATFGSPLRYFHPDAYQTGFITTSPDGMPRWSMFAGPGEQDEVVHVALSVPEVRGVVPYEAVPVTGGEVAIVGPGIDPAEVGGGDGVATGGERASLEGSLIRSCPVDILAGPMPTNQEDAGPLLKTGRWLRAEEDGLVCLVNARALIPRRFLDQGAYVFMGPRGQKIRLQVPRIRQSGQVLAEAPDAGRALATNPPRPPGAVSTLLANGSPGAVSTLLANGSPGAVSTLLANGSPGAVSTLLANGSLGAVSTLLANGSLGAVSTLLANGSLGAAGSPGSSGSLVGTPYFDLSDPVTIELDVVGVYELATRHLHWSYRKTDYYEPLYLEAPEILVPPATYRRILEAMGLPGGAPAPVGALALRLADQATAETTAETLRQALPGYSVVTTVGETAFANSRGLPEPIYVCPPLFQPPTQALRQPVLPATKGRLLGLLMFGFAGVVAAANSTLLVISRRQEFAILRAVGLRGFEVAGVVLVEVLTLALVGLALGYGVGELVTIPALRLNGVPWPEILGLALRDLGVVAGTTLTATAAFSLFPMARSLSITVAEAMRAND
jgi:hypothetical protein